MAVINHDERKLEAELLRIFRSHGVSALNIEGVQHIGLISVRQVGDKGGPYVPGAPPNSVAIAVPTLVRNILEALS
ncbi:hypothetical protein HAP47_0022910 [Bradyrhizobium sp. 41S5]|uniref:hypothetical protein n=1 Tax=Bradyrhizobium sp. 41S5 TaxID=1404443 RepID=UPI00156AD79A|nr:hypothetical protein [Bradyrhizobium sp. 41S5]UFX42114.1 hypothetical protein HAP47_0022910 [Bradyrhizobium sp. 41S5]